jgi:uncharacterized protein (DUF362 family)
VNKVVIGTDPVAVDALGAMEYGINPMKVKHIHSAFEEGLGEARLSWLNPIDVKI